MFFDALTIAAARDEMLETLVPGRVQQVRAVGPLAIGLEIYGNHRRRQLLLSAHAQYARAHLQSKPPSRDPGVRTPFLLLLRKYIRGSILQSIEQPDFERVLVFTFTKVLPSGDRDAPAPEEDEDEEQEPLDDRLAAIPPGFAIFETRLIAEVMGRHSNIVLVAQDGEILDAIKRIPPSLNRVRTTLPHITYSPPPAQRKLNLLTMAERSFENELRDLDSNTTLWQALVARFRAVSPLLAQEAVFRAGGDTGLEVRAADPARLYRELSGLIALAELAEWNPSLALERGPEREPGAGSREPGEEDREPAGRVEHEQPADSQSQGEAEVPAPGSRLPAPVEAPVPLAFAPYPLRHLQATGAELELLPSISQAAELFYAAAEQFSGHAQLKADVMAEIRERLERLERRARSLQGEMDRAAGFEEVRRRGELLLAYMYAVTPGQRELTIPEESLVIKLDPNQTPLEQAQGMFREYQRARAAVEGVPARLETTRLAMSYLEELVSALDLAEDFDTIQVVRADLEAQPSDPEKLADGSREPGAGSRDSRTAGQQGSGNRRTGRQQGRGKAGDGKGKQPTGSRLPAPGSRPVQVNSRDGLVMLYGRSARENDALTFGLARPGDLWLHARGVPGSHVVIRAEGREIPESTIAEAARLAARHSKARSEGAVDVVITERRHVRRIAGAPPGLVTYSGERVLRVRVDERSE